MEERIRQLGPEDYDRLISLWLRAGLHSIRPKGRDSREALVRQMESGILKVLGLEMDGRMIGAVVTTHDSRKGWINRLAVDPDFRRQGCAQRLLEAAENVLHDQGIHIIAALIEGDNAASLSLFNRAGYQEVDTRMHYLSKRENPNV